MEYTYSGFENRISAEHLQKRETVKVIGIGNSMTPILKSKQPVICTPVTKDTILNKRDIVFLQSKWTLLFTSNSCNSKWRIIFNWQ